MTGLRSLPPMADSGCFFTLGYPLFTISGVQINISYRVFLTLPLSQIAVREGSQSDRPSFERNDEIRGGHPRRRAVNA